MELVAVDVGGTHARFAIANVQGGAVTLDEVTTLETADYSSFREAWDVFAQRIDRPLPLNAAFAVAGPVDGDVVRFTNNCWSFRPAAVQADFGLERALVLNDFAAVGYAVAALPDEHFQHLAGPEGPLPRRGTISLIGPGTGLGVAILHREGEVERVHATEGGHIGYGPVDPIEDAIVAHLRRRFGRASSERVASGPAIIDIARVLADLRNEPLPTTDDRKMWQLAASNRNGLASAAADQFFKCLGSVAGDIALAHGADAVVIAGGLALRLRGKFPGSEFNRRFSAKGRFEERLASIPVKLLTHEEAGLHGAARAFASREQFGDPWR